MAKVINNMDDFDYDDVRCPYCREQQMIWVRKYRGNVLYSENGLPHECKELDILNKRKIVTPDQVRGERV